MSASTTVSDRFEGARMSLTGQNRRFGLRGTNDIALSECTPIKPQWVSARPLLVMMGANVERQYGERPEPRAHQECDEACRSEDIAFGIHLDLVDQAKPRAVALHAARSGRVGASQSRPLA
jgi:hypothetical protein